MNKEKITVSIMGCGWLGFPLATFLLDKGFAIKGSTTTPDKMPVMSDHGIEPFLISISPEINQDFESAFFDSEVLILNIPPSRKQPEIVTTYPALIEEVLKIADDTPVQKILFVSSTSVYSNLNRKVNEEEAGGELSASGEALLKAEQILQNQQRFEVSILRFCGLFDSERNPGRFLAGKYLDSNGSDKVNLIHQDDCINVISEILKQSAWGEVFNACADQHPEKEHFYSKATASIGLEAPRFNDTAPSAYKEVDSSKLKKKLNYTFIYPDPEAVIDKS